MRTLAPLLSRVKARRLYTFDGHIGMIGLVNLLLILFSAVMLPIALPNELFLWGLPLVGLVAIVPLFIAVYRARSLRQAMWLGALFGAVSTGLANYWLAFFGDFSIWTIGGTVLGYTGYNALLFAFLYNAVHGIGSDRLRASVLRPVILAVIWTGYEYVKSVGFLGYPWGLIAYAPAAWTSVAQIAELTGVWGLSFIGAFVNTAVAALIVNSRPLFEKLRAPFAAGALIAAAALFGLLVQPRILPNDSFTATLVQQNVDSWSPGRFADALQTAQRLTIEEIERARAEGTEVDVVIWSETALRRPYLEDDDYWELTPQRLPFRLFLRYLDVPLITGAPRRAANGRDAHNSAIAINPDGQLLGWYGKQQLVPFAESIPFWEFAAVQSFFRDAVGLTGTWVPGPQTSVIEVPVADGVISAGFPICFEDAFGWVVREMHYAGADVMINLTNNSWSKRYSAQTQHLVAARLRTIEVRQSLVRGTNSGVTAVLDARGEMTASVPMFESRADTVEVPLYPRRRTLYVLVGDLFGQLAFVFALIGPIVIYWGHKKATGQKTVGGFARYRVVRSNP